MVYLAILVIFIICLIEYRNILSSYPIRAKIVYILLVVISVTLIYGINKNFEVWTPGKVIVKAYTPVSNYFFEYKRE